MIHEPKIVPSGLIQYKNIRASPTNAVYLFFGLKFGEFVHCSCSNKCGICGFFWLMNNSSSSLMSYCSNAFFSIIIIRYQIKKNVERYVIVKKRINNE